MNKTIPIVMVHGGRARPSESEDYLVTTLKQAHQWNERVVLLGGPRVKEYATTAQVGYYDYFTDYYTGVQDFIDNYYTQLSVYTRLYDIAVMERYFVLRDFMLTNDIEMVCNLDSDVMVYCDLSEEARKFPSDMYGAYCIPLEQFKYRMSASAHTAFFSKVGIVKLCDFITSSYKDPERFVTLQEKWDWHVREKKGGGVCDMTHLYLFSQEHPTRVYNLIDAVSSDGVFEHNINVAENGLPEAFRMLDGRKEVVWKNGLPYGFSTKLNMLVRFNTLHLQGRSIKYSAPSFYRVAE